MSESEKPFTVSDRRHFTPDGRLRDAAPPDEGEGSVSATPTPGEEPGAGSASGESRWESTSPSPAAPQGDLPPVDPGEADLSQFLLSLGAQAGMLLSGRGLPEGTDPAEALDGARSIISILEMLKGKTQGRRTPREDEVLEGLLYELRMAYVEASRTSGS